MKVKGLCILPLLGVPDLVLTIPQKLSHPFLDTNHVCLGNHDRSEDFLQSLLVALVKAAAPSKR